MSRLLALLDAPADADGEPARTATRTAGTPHRPGALAGVASPLSDDILPALRRRRRRG